MSEQVEIPHLYSNSVNLIRSFYDFILTFNVNEPHTEKGKVVGQIRPLVTISFSPQHFKVFANMALANLTAYEEEYGEIKLPKPPAKPKGKTKR